jgi:hypothetical protein
MKNPVQCQILRYSIVSVDAYIENGLAVVRRCVEETSVEC